MFVKNKRITDNKRKIIIWLWKVSRDVVFEDQCQTQKLKNISTNVETSKIPSFSKTTILIGSSITHAFDLFEVNMD